MGSHLPEEPSLSPLTHISIRVPPVNLLFFQVTPQVLSFSSFFPNLQKELDAHFLCTMSSISCLVTLSVLGIFVFVFVFLTLFLMQVNKLFPEQTHVFQIHLRINAITRFDTSFYCTPFSSKKAYKNKYLSNIDNQNN